MVNLRTLILDVLLPKIFNKLDNIKLLLHEKNLTLVHFLVTVKCLNEITHKARPFESIKKLKRI
jgi:hypothetical protein